MVYRQVVFFLLVYTVDSLKKIQKKTKRLIFYENTFIEFKSNNFLISKNLLNFFNCTVVKLFNCLSNGKQYILYLIYRSVIIYNPRIIFLFIKNKLASVNRIFFFLLAFYYIKNCRFKNSKVFSILKFYNLNWYLIIQEYIFLIENKFIIRENIFKLSFLYSFKQNIRKFSIKFAKILFQKDINKSNIKFLGISGYLNYTYIYTIEKHLKLNNRFLYYKKIFPIDLIKILSFNINFLHNKNSINFWGNFSLNYKKQFWNANLSKLFRIIFQLVNFPFFYSSFLEYFFKILVKHILFVNGDFKLMEIFRSLINSDISDKKNIFFSCLNRLFLERYDMNTDGCFNTRNNLIFLLKPFTLEKQIKVNQRSYSFYKQLNVQIDLKKNRLTLRLKKRIFKFKCFLNLFNQFFSSHYINCMEKFVKKFFFSKFSNISYKFNYLIKKAFVFALSGFHLIRKKFLKFLSIYYNISPIYFFIVQKCFLLELKKKLDYKFLAAVGSSYSDINVMYSKKILKEFNINLTEILSFIYMGFFRIRYLKLFKISENSINFMVKKYYKYYEVPYYHLFLTTWNLYNQNKQLSPFTEFPRVPVGYNINWENQNFKNICFYINYLKNRLIKISSKINNNKILKNLNKIKIKKKYSSVFQDSADLINIFSKKNCNFLFTSKNFEIENLIIDKQILFNKDKLFLVNLPKLKKIYNLNMLWKKINFIMSDYLKNKIKIHFYGCCCCCFLNIITTKINSVKFRLKTFRVKNFFWSRLSVFFFSKFLAIKLSSIDYLFFYRNFIFSFLELFKNYQRNIISKILLVKINKIVIKYQFFKLFSNFLNFFNLLILLTNNFYENSQIKNFTQSETINFLNPFLNLIRKQQDPLIEFFFHLEKKKLDTIKKNILCVSPQQSSNFKIIFFQNQFQLLTDFFDFNRFIFEKMLDFHQYKKINLAKKIQKPLIKTYILKLPFFTTLRSITYKHRNVAKCTKRIKFVRKYYEIKMKKFISTFFSKEPIFSNKYFFMSIISYFFKINMKEYSFNHMRKVFFKNFLHQKNKIFAKNIIFQYKILLIKNNKYQKIKNQQRKFFYSFFWNFFLYLRGRKYYADFKLYLFPIEDLIKKNNFGDLILIVFVYFFNYLSYPNYRYNNEYNDNFFHILNKTFSVILKNIRGNFCKYLFIDKLNRLLKKKGLFNLKKNLFFLFKYSNIFYSFNKTYNSKNKKKYDKLIAKLIKLTISGNIFHINRFDNLSSSIIRFISERNNKFNIKSNKILELIYSSVGNLPLNLYQNWFAFLIELHDRSFYLKQKILCVIYIFFIQLHYVKIKNRLLKISKCKLCNFYIKENLIYNKVEKLGFRWFFINYEKKVFTASIESLFFFQILSSVQTTLIQKYKLILTKILDFLFEKKEKKFMNYSNNKIIFGIYMKIKKKNLYWIIKKVAEKSWQINTIFNIFIILNVIFLARKITFTQKFVFFNRFLNIYYQNQKKYLLIKNIYEIKNFENYIFDYFGYTYFSYFKTKNQKILFNFLKKALKYKKDSNGNIFINIINGAFKWEDSSKNLLLFFSRLLFSLEKQIEGNKISRFVNTNYFKSQLMFVQKIIDVCTKNITCKFSNNIFNFVFFPKFLYSNIYKYLAEHFDKLTIFILKKKIIKTIILKKIFFFYFDNKFFKKNISALIYNNGTKNIVFILFKLLSKLKNSFVRTEVCRIYILIKIFTKFLFSDDFNFQILGLKGLYILIKKKIISEKQVKLVQYIAFLFVKSPRLSIKLMCISIIIKSLTLLKNFKITFRLVSQVFSNFLYSEKAITRISSFEIVLKIFSNLQFWNKSVNYKNFIYNVFFHVIFDAEPVCQLLAGLLSQFLILKIGICSKISLNRKLDLIRVSNLWVFTRINFVLFWICNTCINIKSYIIIKTYSIISLKFFDKKKVRQIYKWENMYLKSYFFIQSLFREDWCFYISFIGKYFLVAFINFINNSTIWIKLLFFKIYRLYLDNIFEGNICCLIFTQNQEKSNPLAVVDDISVLKKNIFEIQILFLTNFFPNSFKNKNIVNCNIKKTTIKQHNLENNIQTVDCFIRNETFIFFCFNKMLFTSTFIELFKNKKNKKKRGNIKLNLCEFKNIKKILGLLHKITI